MRRTAFRLAAAAAAAILAGAAGRGDVPPEREYRTEEIGPGVYAFVSPETNGPIPSGNVVAVVGDDGVLVVDSGRFPALARRIAAEIRRKTPQPVRYVVHTHWHLDHIVGDEELRKAFPGLAVVTTDFTRAKILEKQVGYLRDVAKNDAGYVGQIDALVARGKRDDGTPLPEAFLRYLKAESRDLALEAAELAGASVVPPSLTFDRSATIHLGKREVRLLFLGAGNTAGDTVVEVPDAKVVATGDLLVAPVPYGYGCHPKEWIATLEKLSAMDARAIVPGHGPVMRDWTYAKKVAGLLEAVRSQVGEAVRSGATLEETQRRVDLKELKKAFAGDDYDRGRAFSDFFAQSAIERAYQEAKGTLAEE
jgi:glyoxylase-like metal-dependent hydrolase (beta-lactamase superfamily II)